jgi:Chaperone of endosialidase
MSYEIQLTNGSVLIASLADNSADGPGQATQHSSITLIGRDYVGYGQFLNDNLIHMLENFSNTSSPSDPLIGQLWWDSTNKVLKTYSGTSWKVNTAVTTSTSFPTDVSTIGGDLYFDTYNKQLWCWNGSTWTLIGPQSSVSTGNTGAFPAVISDTSSGTHQVIELTINGTIYAIIATNAFTTALTGFTNIVPGLNFSTAATFPLQLNTQYTTATANTIVQRDSSGSITGNTINGTVINGTTVNATTINGSLNGTLTGNVIASTVTSSTISTGTLVASSSISGTLVTASQPNITSLGNVTNIQLNGSATLNGQAIATIGGSSSFTSINNTVIGNLTPSTGAFTTLSVGTALTPTANAVISLGTSTAFWNNFYTVTGGFNNINLASSLTFGSATGSSTSATLGVTGGSLQLASTIANNGINLVASIGGTSTTVLSISGTTGLATVYGNPTNSLGIATKNYVDSAISNIINGTSSISAFSSSLIPSGSYNIGSSSAYWTNGYITTLNATTIRASSIGQIGATLTGTLSSGPQSGITAVGALTSGTWQASVIGGAYGGTGVNNGANTLSLNGSYTLNQSVAIGASPSFIGTNFTGTASSLTAGAANSVAWSNITGVPSTIVYNGGGSYNISVTGTAGGVAWSNITGVPSTLVYNTGGTYGINITGTAGGVAWSNISSVPSNLVYSNGGTYSLYATNITQYTINQSVGTGNSPSFSSVYAGAFYYSSDALLKSNVLKLDTDAIDLLKPVTFIWNNNGKSDTGFIAQDIQQAIPEAVTENENGSLAVNSTPIIAHLVKRVQDQQREIETLKQNVPKFRWFKRADGTQTMQVQYANLDWQDILDAQE